MCESGGSNVGTLGGKHWCLVVGRFAPNGALAVDVLRVTVASVLPAVRSCRSGACFGSGKAVPFVSLSRLPVVTSGLPNSTARSYFTSSGGLGTFLSVIDIATFSSPKTDHAF